MPAPRRSRTPAAATPEREKHVLFSLYVLKHISTKDITRHICKVSREKWCHWGHRIKIWLQNHLWAAYLGLLNQTCVMLKGREKEKSANYSKKIWCFSALVNTLLTIKLLLLRPTIQGFLKNTPLYTFFYIYRKTFACFKMRLHVSDLSFVHISLTQFTGWYRGVPAEVLLALNLTDAFQSVTTFTFKSDVSPRAISISFYGFLNTLNFWEYTSDLWN